MPGFPDFFRLKFSFDADRIYDELQPLQQFAKPTGINAKWLNQQPPDNPFFDPKEVLDVSSGFYADGRFIHQEKKYPSWRVLSLTHVPGVKGSGFGPPRLRLSHPDDWVWNAEYSTPYTRSVVEQLPFERISIVRLLWIPAGGIGPFHTDYDDSYWDEAECASLTLTVRDGGVPLVIHCDGEYHSRNDSAFYFKDSVLHAVPPTISERLIIRVFGVPQITGLRALMDESSIICRTERRGQGISG